MLFFKNFIRKLLLLCCFYILLWTACDKHSSVSAGIVSLSPAMTELICKLGQGERLVGRSDVCDFPESVLSVPVVGKFGDPNAERILALAPAYLVTNDLINPNVKSVFESAGIKVLLLPVRTPEDYYICVKELGKALDCEDAASAEIMRFKAKMSKLKSLPPIDLRAIFAVWDDPMMVAGSGSFPDTVLMLVGIKNQASSVKQEYFRCSYEWLRENEPDVLIFSHQFPQLEQNPYLNDLSAVREKRIVIPENESAILRPGPRLPDALLALRGQLERYRK